MITNLNILFYLRRDKTDPRGNSPIYCRITIAKERADFAIKRMISFTRWEAAKSRVKGSTPEAKEINAHILFIQNRIFELSHSIEQGKKKISAAILRDELLGKESKSMKDSCVIKLFQAHNTKVKKLINIDFAEGTWERYETCLKHVKDFIRKHYETDYFPVGQVNNEFIAEFDYYLRTVRHCENNSAVKYLRNFRKIIRLALANDLIEKDPFKHYKGRITEVEKQCLTASELDQVRDKAISIPRLELVRDIFLFSCYTGLAYTDVQKLTKENIQVGVDGEKWIFTRRTKTKVVSNIPLLPTAISLIQKYEHHPEVITKGVVMPIFSNQKMNAYLKEIADICGINKVLTFHIARHTFATTVSLSNGVPIESVSKMLGHKNIRTTQHYAKVVDKKVGGDMQTLIKKLQNKKE